MSDSSDNGAGAILPALGTGSLSFDRVANDYDRTRGYPPEVARTIAESIARHGTLDAGAEALEIGVGTGRIAIPLLRLGINIVGADISVRMTEILRAKYEAERKFHPYLPWGSLEITLADSSRLPYQDGRFDAVIAVHVLHLITDWRKALSEALRVVRPGGSLLLGQDMAHGSSIGHPFQDEWLAIVGELGYVPKRLGASRFADILEEARARSLMNEEWDVVEWTGAQTAEEGFADIADRLWSLTWQTPEPIFSESIRRLELWARARFGDHWTRPEPVRFSFRLAQVTQEKK
ncbi:MAG TPA: class I SAM-dependent methyltransferase [Ktedonobacterales bacterium]